MLVLSSALNAAFAFRAAAARIEVVTPETKLDAAEEDDETLIRVVIGTLIDATEDNDDPSRMPFCICELKAAVEDELLPSFTNVETCEERCGFDSVADSIKIFVLNDAEVSEIEFALISKET